MTDIDLLGRTLGPFEVIAELGRGGMAVVYKARQIDLQRQVALKILPPALSRDSSYLQRFLLEARSAAALEHPHIVPIYAIGEAQGFNYIAMKYIAGTTLKEIVQQQGALDIAHAAAMLEQVADALDYAHSQGLIHRDIKPSNMMAERSGWVYLTDFGLARGSEGTQGLTQIGTVMGTPEYMSPEQAQGQAALGPPTDIYALGVVLYELLTGQVPFQADTPMGMLIARLQYAPRPPRDYRSDLPEAVEDVIMRALARKPEMRFASASELVAALKRAAGLSAHGFAPTQRPISPPQGLAAPQPANPAQSLAPTLPVESALRPPPADTPPYIIPAGDVPALSAPRSATPPAQPAAQFALPATAALPAAEQPRRSRRGLWIGLGAIGLLLVAALLIAPFLLGRPDPRIAQGLSDGRAALGQKGGLDRAIAAYQGVLAIEPHNAAAPAMLALIYNLRDRTHEAEAAARAAIAADPQSALAYSQLANALANRGEYQDALAAANRAIELNGRLALGYGARSGIRANLAAESSDAGLLQQAAADADKAIELAQSDDNLAQALAHSARGYVYWQAYSLTADQAKVASGVEEYNRAIGLQSQLALLHTNLGYFYDAQGEHERAKQKFEAALDADDQYGHTHAGLGWNLYYLKDYSGALGEFDKALELNPNDVDAYVGKSYVYQYGDDVDYDKAIEALEQAAAIAPKSPSVRSNVGWVERARGVGFEYGSDEQKSAYAEAERRFRQALGLNATFVDALSGLGWVLQDQADLLKDDAKYHESIELLQQSLALKPDQPFASSALGWSQYGLKQYAQAEQAFNRAIELKSDYADAYYGLGRTLQDQGKTDDARKAYQTAVENGSDNAQQLLDQLK